MAWLTPTSDAVLGGMAPQEVSAIQSVAGQDVLDDIVSQEVAEIRGYIRSGDYELATDTSQIPDSLLTDLIAICRWRLLNTIPELQRFTTPAREKDYEDSVKKLRSIADQQFSIEEITPASIPRVGTWNAERKLVPRTHPPPLPSQQSQPPTDGGYANPNAPKDE
jgi:hypothetical protein